MCQHRLETFNTTCSRWYGSPTAVEQGPAGSTATTGPAAETKARRRSGSSGELGGIRFSARQKRILGQRSGSHAFLPSTGRNSYDKKTKKNWGTAGKAGSKKFKGKSKHGDDSKGKGEPSLSMLHVSIYMIASDLKTTHSCFGVFMAILEEGDFSEYI